MSDGSTPSYDTEGLSEETLRMAALGRGEEPSTDNAEDNSDEGAEAAAAEGTPETSEDIPEWVPEKFRKDGKADFESLAKAYGELQKKLGAPKEEPAKEEESKSDDDEKGDDAPDYRETMQSSIADAREEYAKAGKLSDDTYNNLTEMLGKDYVDTYLSGVAAMEAALTASVYETAGGEEDYKAAIEWARESWSDSKIAKFDAALSDEDMMPTMVKALMGDYREANPGEGQSTRPGSGVSTEDVYTDKDEFIRDLAAADEAGDALARRKATQKLQRSKKAGSIGHITPRSGLKRFQ